MKTICSSLSIGVLLAIFFLVGCTKEKVVEYEDHYISKPETIKALDLTLNSVGTNFIEVTWEGAISSTFRPVSYNVYINDALVAHDITSSIYTFINLEADQFYNIKVQAKSESGLSVQNTLDTKTLSKDSNASTSKYREIEIFDKGILMGGNGVCRLRDGDHLITRVIQHPNHYQYQTTKMITFRVDKSGQVLWYRLFSTNDYDFAGTYTGMITDNSDQEVVVISGKVIYKLDTENGKIIAINQLLDDIPGFDNISSSIPTAKGDILLGTVLGEFMALDFNTLTVSWKRAKFDQNGAIKSIQLDSKGNAYYIFETEGFQIRVHKVDPKGAFIAEYKFDGTLAGERAPNGFNMTILRVDKNDDFYLLGRNYNFHYYRYFKFDAAGNQLLKLENSSSFAPAGAFFDHDDNLVVYGRIDGAGLNTTAWIYTYDKSMNLIKAISYPELPMQNIHFVSQNSNGSLDIFLHFVHTLSYSNFNLIYITTLPDGKLQ